MLKVNVLPIQSRTLLTPLRFLDGEIRFSPTDLHATNYHIVGLDLRSVDEVSNKLKQSDVDFNLPTIFLGELTFGNSNIRNLNFNFSLQPNAFWSTSRLQTATISLNGFRQILVQLLSSTTSR